ncbi:hypothetical protein [Epilithonimonas sp.]|uniref:hypothetical protein n=1 Tax=Epilithonimonas sp. TaxID=2894511 RepID=UPI0028A0A6CC|nr:hypothetical protein [Epilithonimonas sp.]
MESSYRLYQTLKDKGNHIDCEINGPFSCKWENTWLGEGYYFWFHHLELAIWWGNVTKNKKFVVYKSICTNIEKCWDLHANPNHQEEFIKWLKILNSKGYLSDETTVAQVVEFIKNECAEFDYQAIRILGIDSLSETSARNYKMPRIKFEIPRENDNEDSQRFAAYLDIIPPVQVCLFTKDALERKDYAVEFPDIYRKENRSVQIFI